MTVGHQPTRASRLTPFAIALFVVWAMALAVRLYAITWDEGQDLHPDELFVAKIVIVDRIRLEQPISLENLLTPERSTLNPRSSDPGTGLPREFAYGALPLFVTDFVAWILSKVTGTPWNDGGHVYLVGRAMSAIVDSLTVLVVFAMAKMIAGRRAAIVAALFAGLAPMMIQLSHFFTMDVWVSFFVALCLWQTMRATRAPSVGNYALAGFAAGLAMASKGSVFTLFGVIAAAAVVTFAFSPMRHDMARGMRWLASRIGAAALTATVGFGLFEPYALMRPGTYLESLRIQARIVRGQFDVPFTRHFVDDGPLEAIAHLARWGVGPVFFWLAMLGVVLLAITMWRQRSVTIGVLLLWLAGYTLVVLASEVQFLRYFAPIVPVLAVAAGVATMRLTTWAGRVLPLRVARAIPVLSGIGVALWAIAFLSIYAQEHPRLAASRWMYASLPPGSITTGEIWDDGLPRSFNPVLNGPVFQFAFQAVDIYSDSVPPETADRLRRVVRQVDDIVLSSNRVVTSINAAPWRYPVQQEFYRALDDGSLGFGPAVVFQVQPKLFGWTFNDATADESFINYDHPTVKIYPETERVSKEQFDERMAVAVSQPWSPTRYPPSATSATTPEGEPIGDLMLADPVGTLPVVGDARWSSGLTSNSAIALLVWVAFLILLQVIGEPITARVFSAFADLGVGFSRWLTVLLAAWVVWFGSSLHVLQFRAWICWLALAVVAIGSYVLVRRSRYHWRIQLRGASVAFWSVFLLFLLFRYLNPDSWHPIWGGEKPMEFAHINALLRTPSFPPYDPWFSGGILNYYYYGMYLVAFMMKTVGIPSEIAFNLAQPTMMGLIASGAWSISSTLGMAMTDRPRLARTAGVFGVIFTVLIGNLTSVARLVSAQRPPFSDYGAWVWDGSRAIQDAITEFPFFTGLYADLHAHVVALPITVLLIGLAYAVARGGPTTSRAQIGRLVIVALTLGSLSATNAWDVPVYAALVVIAIWMAYGDVADWRRRMLPVGVTAAVTMIASYLLAYPFHRHFVALFGSLSTVYSPTQPWQWAVHVGGLALVGTLGLAILVTPRDEEMRPFWARPETAGWALVLVAGFAAVARVALQRSFPLTPGLMAISGLIVLALAWQTCNLEPRRGWQRLVAVLPVVVGAPLFVVGLLVDRVVFALAITGFAFAVAVWMHHRALSARFTALLLAAAWGVVAGVELVVVADDLIGGSAYRMNTVFKFYNQVWILMAIAAAALIAPALMASQDLAPSRLSAFRIRGQWATAMVIAAVVVVLAGATYPAFAISPRLHQRWVPELSSGTLNALDWMDGAALPSQGYSGQAITFGSDREAIDWMNQNISGTPVIAEAAIGPYRCNGSRFTIATGLPTILGWERHEAQQRNPGDLGPRAEDVNLLYSSSDIGQKQAILDRYEVEYVVVGDLERAYPIGGGECATRESPQGIAAFEAMVGTSLEVAFDNGGTRIYRVLRPDPMDAAS